jgi:hypothetical protein
MQYQPLGFVELSDWRQASRNGDEVVMAIFKVHVVYIILNIKMLNTNNLYLGILGWFQNSITHFNIRIYTTNLERRLKNSNLNFKMTKGKNSIQA